MGICLLTFQEYLCARHWQSSQESLGWNSDQWMSQIDFIVCPHQSIHYPVPVICGFHRDTLYTFLVGFQVGENSGHVVF